MNFCSSKDKSCPTNWAVFPAVFLLNFSKRQKLLFSFDYIFYFLILGFFLVIVYKLALFFLNISTDGRSQGHWLLWDVNLRDLPAPFFSLVSDQPLCTAKAFGSVTIEI